MASPEIFQPIIHYSDSPKKSLLDFREADPLELSFWISKKLSTGSGRKTQPTPPTLYSTQLQWSQSTKYLGLILDKKLTWKQHLTHKRDKFRKALRALYPLIGWNSELNMYNKILLYTAVLRPILTYGSPVWGYAADSNIKIIEVAQNSIIRNIVKADRYTKNSYIYKDIKVLPLKNYIQKLAINFFQ
ncbi:putative RNA-directed DNA polymerase from transposon X-element [Trichonephila clavipes]|uniref:Putative RNA-directed DNA polymerase from transposon X-element n=1 Tax=Trichonephila clavipes TaxID=2585209 RepID=A0A8X6R1X7_TRICX|nr:putative RNA-directed DNA polymerase from transposon X-element [Trichonephila clavipes]